MIVTCEEEKSLKLVYTTVANGKIHFQGLSKKWLDFDMKDPNYVYSEGKSYISNELRTEVTKSFYLTYGELKEAALIKDKSNVPNSDDTLSIYKIVSRENSSCGKADWKEVEYTGGFGEMMKFIQHNLRYPHVVMEKKIMGKVYLKFIIEADGIISHVSFQRGLGG